jgi:membrane-associated phospholipid phosphatase
MMVLARSSVLPLVVAMLLCTRLGQAAPDPSPKHYELKHTNWTFLLGESVMAGSAYVGAWLFTGGPKATCHWCRTNSFDDSIRNALRADDSRPPAFISHALSVGAIPVLAMTGLVAPAGRDAQWHRGLEDAWIVANTFFVTSAVGETVKHLVARQRPAFYYRRQSATEFDVYPSERNKSFFSLDTAWAFSIVSSSTTLALLRGYSTAPYIAVGGGLLALTAGTLRIVSDAHWATDVLTGAAVGTGIGIAMPLLLHGRSNGETPGTASSVSVAPLGLGSGVSIAVQF